MAKPKPKKQPASSAPDRLKIEVRVNVNQVRRGDRLTVEDNATNRALIANGYYRLLADGSE